MAAKYILLFIACKLVFLSLISQVVVCLLYVLDIKTET